MLFSLAWLFNFLIGGLSGVFLSDVPSDVTTHGSFFSMAHFHYTIMGGLLFAFFAGIYYWVPKMTGYKFNERSGKLHFWVMFIAFNSTFGPLLVIGFLGMPRRVVTYAGYLQGANVWVSVSAFVLGASMLIFLANFVWSQVFARVPTGTNPWGSKSIEWQLPSPVPVHNFDRIPTFGADPYPYGDDAGSLLQRPVVAPARPTPMSELAQPLDRLLGRRARAAAGDGAQPARRLAALGERDRVLLLRVPVRVLLSPLAELTRASGIRITCRRRSGSGRRSPSASSCPRSTTGFAVRRLHDDDAGTWRLKGLVALALGLARSSCRSIEWATIGFGPTDGGFASVFLGWTGLYILFVFCTMYWLETLLATSFRYRGARSGRP